MINKKNLLIISPIILSLFFLGGLYIGANLDYLVSNPTDPGFKKLKQVYKELTQNYLNKDDIIFKKAEYGAIKGFVDSINDQYTYFMEPDETKDFLDSINGSFEGIGAEVGLNEDKQIIVIAPLEGTPAQKAGLLPQDIILTINETSTAGMTLEKGVSLIKGKKGTVVNLTIKRENEKEPIIILIERGLIKIPVLKLNIINNSIAHIKLFNFNENASEEFNKVAQQILSLGIDKIILDLRYNPGGILQEAVEIGSWFIEKGKIIASEQYSDGTLKNYNSLGNGQLANLNLVVLINKGSASASEILAGALFDHNKAPLVGETTFGKGTVQVLKNFNDGSTLRVTVSKWLLPKGTSINKEGVKPTILIKMDKIPKNDKQDLQLQKAIEILTK
ncbi:MAG: Carboxyl-terminal protease [Candidatus Roizmanbacteria bacterium GW2011_GWA2_32_13]|uniref:Carboxyl-terminal protease n=1 Tax=Candidatus Roizmanbacteria bacterium GW2011_GWA2_32_13 TaxID=1618475 RepID=A0A0F9Z074_9BACT|nr:MAG: Carboxyl-terminal protease [Candidatus Roizmanbacteria bacterium GW2011_GWA2_32_13]